MTGTARGSQRELSHFYGLDTEVIPTRKPCLRRVLNTRFFATADCKWEAIADDVVRLHRTGRPVLVGTRTIDSSEEVARRLRQRQLPFQLLNGKQDAAEAEIVAGAGRHGAITVATNMAGRGTDIRLDAEVVSLGGLHVIVSEPHASRRVDRQLIGRAARQGDPGSCQIFAAADDELIARHADWLAKHIRTAAGPDGEVAEDLTKALRRVQQKAERLAFARRRQLFARDAWLEDVMSTLVGDRSV